MADKMTVEEAAAIFHIAPPDDAKLGAYLVQLVQKADAEGRGEKLRSNWKAEREMWRVFVDPDAIFIGEPGPTSDVV